MLIAESGATKTEWRLCAEGKLLHAFRSRGFNPNVMPRALLESEMQEVLRSQLPASHEIGRVFFYGAGLRGENQRALVKTVLAQSLPQARIEVAHDLLAAARSCQREEGIVGILGTGSNTAHYQRGVLLSTRGGHSYLFGDEGSGADLGLSLMKGLLLDDFPAEVRTFIEQQAGYSIYDLKIAILQSEVPNVRLAQLAKYLDELTHVPEIQAMIQERMRAFFQTTICRYPNYQELPVDLVGAISHAFRHTLQAAAQEYQVQLMSIVSDPIKSLVAYHLKRG
jgi:glucosamine kinase